MVQIPADSVSEIQKQRLINSAYNHNNCNNKRTYLYSGSLTNDTLPFDLSCSQ
ncbi:hypothetical protein HanIR_Chr01g0023241 [Helianthus annuus]|nr:hypothetical protein HanIR_Chr11g0505941 [Helianthus annuus]KAJ0622666.1 hypothetical protein HanIR_Chr01g0023241 [Helianthus annuus]